MGNFLFGGLAGGLGAVGQGLGAIGTGISQGLSAVGGGLGAIGAGIAGAGRAIGQGLHDFGLAATRHLTTWLQERIDEFHEWLRDTTAHALGSSLAWLALLLLVGKALRRVEPSPRYFNVWLWALVQEGITGHFEELSVPLLPLWAWWGAVWLLSVVILSLVPKITDAADVLRLSKWWQHVAMTLSAWWVVFGCAITANFVFVSLGTSRALDGVAYVSSFVLAELGKGLWPLLASATQGAFLGVLHVSGWPLVALLAALGTVHMNVHVAVAPVRHNFPRLDWAPPQHAYAPTRALTTLRLLIFAYVVRFIGQLLLLNSRHRLVNAFDLLPTILPSDRLSMVAVSSIAFTATYMFSSNAWRAHLMRDYVGVSVFRAAVLALPMVHTLLLIAANANLRQIWSETVEWTTASLVSADLAFAAFSLAVHRIRLG